MKNERYKQMDDCTEVMIIPSYSNLIEVNDLKTKAINEKNN